MKGQTPGNNCHYYERKALKKTLKKPLSVAVASNVKHGTSMRDQPSGIVMMIRYSVLHFKFCIDWLTMLIDPLWILFC